MNFIRTVETTVDRPAGEVFKYLSDITRHPEWADNPLTVTHVSGPLTGVGATFRTRAEHVIPHAPKGFDGTVVVQASEPNQLLVYEAHDEGGRFRWTFTLAATGDGGTVVAHTVERMAARLPVRVLQPVMWKVFGGGQVRRGLQNVKAQLERSDQPCL